MAGINPPKSLVVTHVISGDLWAGAEAQVLQLISGLRAGTVIRPTAIVFNPGVLYERLIALKLEVTIADESLLSPLEQIKVIGKHLQKHSTDIVHTHGFKENVLGTASQYLAGVKHSLQTVHGSPELQSTWREPKRKLTQVLDYVVAKFFQDAVVAVSQHLQNLLEQRFPSKTVVIRNFIETDQTPTTSHERPVNQTSSKSLSRLALVGRCVAVKRVDLFIDTIAMLRANYNLEVEGTVYGDGPLVGNMKQYAKTKSVAEFIHFRGFVQDMDPEWPSIDILVMPSDHEGLPMTLLEALQRSVPVVAHNVGGIPEVLDHGRCGSLVDNHTAFGYADSVANLIRHPEIARQRASNGPNHIRKEFSNHGNVQQYEALYLSIAQKKHPSEKYP